MTEKEIDDLLKEAREWEEALLASDNDKDIGAFIGRLRHCMQELRKRLD